MPECILILYEFVLSVSLLVDRPRSPLNQRRSVMEAGNLAPEEERREVIEECGWFV